MKNRGRGSAATITSTSCGITGLLLLVVVSDLASVDAYSTYIVGDGVGWVSNLTNPISYTKWASGKTFSLGDTLVFNYINNHTVVQTFSEDTYKSCNLNDNNDTTYQVWSSESSTRSVVHLTTTGLTYFICSAYDGLHCLGGMRFAINVSYGLGLPPAPSPSPSSSTGIQYPSGMPKTQSNTPTTNTYNGGKNTRIFSFKNYCMVLLMLVGVLPFLE